MFDKKETKVTINRVKDKFDWYYLYRWGVNWSVITSSWILKAMLSVYWKQLCLIAVNRLWFEETVCLNVTCCEIVHDVSVCRFTSSDTLLETVVVPVRVVDSGSGVVELGSTPLVVPQFYSLSNAIDSSVLNIWTTADPVCTVRLMTADTSVPALGQLVREEDPMQRRGTSHLISELV